MDPHSLAATLDDVQETLFYGGELSAGRLEAVAAYLAGRQHRSGEWAGMLAPTERDYHTGVRLFTGEKLQTKLAARHVLTAETARLLALLRPADPARRRAEGWLLRQCFADGCVIGECAHSAVALMRYLAVSGRDDAPARLQALLARLSRLRSGSGRWRRFPFYYTLLALVEIDLPGALEELAYARPAGERYLRRASPDDAFGRRRRAVVQQALLRCGRPPAVAQMVLLS
ncbi:MAG: hypothetical protein JXA37_03060 [Chloroflexia bacterium]|nr:hypothetical protein [Chloroflexia bacterium]